MTGRGLAVALAVAFGGGYLARFLVCTFRCSERAVLLYRRVLVAEANQNHELCKVTENAMAKYIASQEARLDALEHPGRVVDEAERITREGS